MFQTRVRELREAAGYKSQQAFADTFGVAQSTVGGWESGKREPNYETTIRLSNFFNVPIDYLLGNEHNLMQDECSQLFRHNISIALELLNKDDFSDAPEAKYDYYKLQELVKSTYPLTLKEADEVADIIGVPLHNLLREDYEDFLQQKTPTPVTEDGLNDIERLLMKYVKSLTSDQQKMLLAQMQVMKESQKESLSPAVQD